MDVAVGNGSAISGEPRHVLGRLPPAPSVDWLPQPDRTRTISPSLRVLATLADVLASDRRVVRTKRTRRGAGRRVTRSASAPN